MKCAINEIFGPTIQGEGLFNGVPSIFVRFNGCNLRCCFKGGSICDTAYTSHKPEQAKYTNTDEALDEIEKILEKYPEVTDIVFTGGEPMLQQEAMRHIIKQLNLDYDLCYTVETNGTIPVSDDMRDLVHLWSISPKLSNSECFEGCGISKALQKQHHDTRLNYNSILTYINDGNVQLKFVYTDQETEIEIAQWMQNLYDMNIWDCITEPLPVLIMPEGETVEQITKSSEDAIRACIKHGWRFCDRVHIRIWGNKRAV